MASLQVLEDEVESFCRGWAQAQADEATGRTGFADLGAVEAAHPLVVGRDTLAALQASLDSARMVEAQRPRLVALASFLFRAAVEAGARTADDALRRARKASVVSVGGVSFPLEGAWAAVAEESDGQRRAALSRATDEAELQLLSSVQRRWEAAHAAAQSLGAPLAPVLSTLEAEAQDFLAATEDAWRDVLAYACGRLDRQLRPLPQGNAALHDLLRLAEAPLPGAFPQDERLKAVREWLLASGLTLEASGRVRLDEEARGGLASAECFALEVPERVLLVLPERGRGSFPGFLDSVGRARATAAVSPSAPLFAKRLGDAAVRASSGALFRGVLLSAPWLRRFLGHGRGLSREVARLAALSRLGQLRMLAARLLLMRGLFEAGPSLSGLETLASATSDALFLEVPKGALLPALYGFPSEAETLRAAALAECLQRQADEAFDAEDFRNPEAARWLSGVWARGTEYDAEALAKQLGGSLSLAEVGRRLLAVLGA
jgi:hypothetical protein